MAELKDYALTSLSDVKESMNIPSSVTKFDNLIKRKINQATAMIETYCGRRFKQTEYSGATAELLDATGSAELALKNRPIVGDVVLEVRDTILNEDDFETLDTKLVFIDNSAGLLKLNFRTPGKWQQYRASYTAGYQTIPDDLAEACATLAAYLVTNADGQVAVQEKQEGQRRIRYFPGITNAYNLFQQLGIDAVIDSYQNSPFYAKAA